MHEYIWYVLLLFRFRVQYTNKMLQMYQRALYDELQSV